MNLKSPRLLNCINRPQAMILSRKNVGDSFYVSIGQYMPLVLQGIVVQKYEQVHGTLVITFGASSIRGVIVPGMFNSQKRYTAFWVSECGQSGLVHYDVEEVTNILRDYQNQAEREAENCMAL
jgi:hypothetical protein